jgi:hypothetical protein
MKMKFQILEHLSDVINYNKLVSNFGKNDTNEYLVWILLNQDAIDMNDYIKTYPDWTLAGLVEDMYGMFCLDCISWKEYILTNEAFNE